MLEYQPQIRLPKTGFVSYEPFYPQQKLLIDDTDFRALNKGRQMGFTTTFAIDALHDFIYTPASEIVTLSKSEKEAKKFLDKFYDAYDSVAGVDPNVPLLEERNKYNAVGENGSTIDVLTSSRGAGRSFSASKAYFDEMAHTMYADEIYDSLLPTLSQTGGSVTVFSTPRGRLGQFADIAKNPKDNGFSYHQYEWWFHPDWNPFYEQTIQAFEKGDRKAYNHYVERAKTGEWYKKMRNKYSEASFKQEFECSFDVSAATVFTQRQLNYGFKKNWLTEVDNDPFCPEMWTSEPEKGRHYVTGIDLGRKRDATVIVTFDVTKTPSPLVEYKRIPPSSSDWGLIELAVRATHDKFKSEMVHDATGAGDPISELLEDISEPFVITHGQGSKAKYHIVENVRRAFDDNAIVLPRIRQLYKEFEQYEWMDKDIVQDSVMAVALAVYMWYEPDNIFLGAVEDFSYTEV